MTDAGKAIAYIFLFGLLVGTSIFGDDLRAAYFGSNDANNSDVLARVKALEFENIANGSLKNRVEANTNLTLEIQRNQIKINEQLQNLTEMVKAMQAREWERIARSDRGIPD